MCDCAEKMDENLKPHGGRLQRGIFLRSNTLDARILIATVKTDPKRRKALPAVAASFCPFCGTKFVP